jgi:hypothetical protein
MDKIAQVLACLIGGCLATFLFGYFAESNGVWGTIWKGTLTFLCMLSCLAICSTIASLFDDTKATDNS